MLLDSFELPISWSKIQVDDAVKSISTSGKKIPQKEYLSHGALPVIDQGQDFIGGYTNDFSLKVECTLPIIIFGDHTRVVKYINQDFAAGADGVKVLESKGFFNVKLLNYFIQYITSKLPSHGYARHYQHLSKESLPLPPLNEQYRIVAKIEELFSELDQGIDNLKTAQAQLKVYRQALLKHAFEGKLTAEWRAQNADKLESASVLQQRIQHAREQRYEQQLAEWQANGKQGGKPKAPKPIAPLTAEELAELPELPEGWGWTRLIESCAEVVDCHNKTAPYQSSGIPLIRTPSIRNMRVNFDESIRYVSEETYNFWSKRCPPQSGDILFTREAPMGEAGIVPKGKTVCMGQRMMLLRPSKNLVASFLLFSTQTPLFKKISEKVAVGTGVKHLRVGDVEKLIFPICSLDEQNEIAKNLESLFSEIDQLDQTITTSLQQAEALRQSILKKAFSGELVQQDPNDEPAAALLTRIQAEKAAQTTKQGKSGKVAA